MCVVGNPKVEPSGAHLAAVEGRFGRDLSDAEKYRVAQALAMAEVDPVEVARLAVVGAAAERAEAILRREP